MRTLLLLLLLLVACLADTGGDRHPRGLLGGGVVSKVRAGLDAAGRLLGLDTARGVANLVTSSFKASSGSRQSDGLFAGFFRILGFDTSKLGAIALNGLIFLAQMISNSLTGRTKLSEEDQEQYKHRPGSPLTWILNSDNEELKSLVDQAQERSLPDQLVDELRSLPHHGHETPCAQLLVCKAAPFVWGMQDAIGTLLGRREQPPLSPGATPLQRMWAYLPDREAVRTHGDQCEERFPQCSLLS